MVWIPKPPSNLPHKWKVVAEEIADFIIILMGVLLWFGLIMII